MPDLDRITKLLALTGSDNEPEALNALRQLRRTLDNAGMTMVDLANLIHGREPNADLERDLETTRRQLRQARRVLRATRSNGRSDAELRDLRQRLRLLNAENQSLRQELDQRTSELDEWQAAHSVLDLTLRRSSQERILLKSRLRQQQMEMDRVLGEVRGMIDVSSRLRCLVDPQPPAAKRSRDEMWRPRPDSNLQAGAGTRY